MKLTQLHEQTLHKLLIEGEWDQPLDKPALPKPFQQLTYQQRKAAKLQQAKEKAAKAEKTCLTSGYKNGVRGFPKRQYTEQDAKAWAAHKGYSYYLCPHCKQWHVSGQHSSRSGIKMY